MNASSAPKDKYFLSLEFGDHKQQVGLEHDEESIKELIGSLFVCTRIVIGVEDTDQSTIFHVLFSLASHLQWKNIDSTLKKKQINTKSYNGIPLHSFTKGLQYIMAVDQEPFFWNLNRNRAHRMLELKQLKRKYNHLDVPDTAEV